MVIEWIILNLKRKTPMKKAPRKKRLNRAKQANNFINLFHEDTPDAVSIQSIS